jgi:predicted TIM-barrel fold metal-dependent hydrolase
MQRLYIDANAAVGRQNHPEPRIPHRVETLLSDMAYSRVHGALVQSHVARDYSYVAGNAETCAAFRAHPRLAGVALVAPGMDYELAEGSAYLDSLVAQGFKALSLSPRTCAHEFSPFLLERIAGFCIDHLLPLVVDRSEVELEDLWRMLRAFPGLQILLSGSSWYDDRTLFALMEQCPGLHFELSNNQANDVLTVCKEHFGIDRILFGSGHPEKAPGVLKALVEYSGLSDADKTLVASGNALRLFRLDPAAFPLYDEADCELDGISRTVDAGLPLWNEHVVDCHAHMVDPDHQAVSHVPMYRTDPGAMVRSMDRLGIETLMTSPWEGIMTAGGSNESALAACRAHPGRILAYATWNPNYPPDLDAVIDVYHERHRFPGIKPYLPRHHVDLLDARYARWFSYGNEHHLIVLVHAETPDVAAMVDALSQRYPDASFLLAHSGASYDVARANAAVARDRPNVYAEITYTSVTYGSIEYLVETAGADKVLFGSDIPMRDPAPQLAWVAYARISEEDKRKILGGNIRGLLARTYPLASSSIMR